MILKEIKPGMVIHCKTEEEANILFKEFVRLGYRWINGKDIFKTYFESHEDGYGYHIHEDRTVSHDDINYYKNKVPKCGEITPFPSLVIEEKTYEDGLNEAWGLYTKIFNMSYETRNKVFGVDSCNNGISSIYQNFTPQEVMTKLAEYEAKQFTAGDVVQDRNTSYKAVVTRAEEEILYIVYADGSTGEWHPHECVKTGKKVDLTALFSVFEEKDKCLL